MVARLVAPDLRKTVLICRNARRHKALTIGCAVGCADGCAKGVYRPSRSATYSCRPSKELSRGAGGSESVPYSYRSEPRAWRICLLIFARLRASEHLG